MQASQIIARARSLADLPNAQSVSYGDSLNTLRESHKDIYAWLLANDDDYYVTETVITLTSAMQSATDRGTGEWLVPLPDDFQTLRYLDQNQNGRWTTVEKYSLSQHNNSPSDPMYRIRGAYLWIIGGVSLSTGNQLRVGYYPVALDPNLPDADLTFGSSYSDANKALLTYPCWAPPGRTLCYVYSTTSIYAESVDNATVATPVLLATTGSAASFLTWHKGYLYWIQGGNVWRAATALSATMSGASLTASGSVTSFSIASDMIYWTDATTIRSCALDGTSAAVVATVSGVSYPAKTAAGPVAYVVNSTGAVVTTAPVATLATGGVSQLYLDPGGDGNALLALDTAYDLRSWACAAGTGGTLSVATDVTVRTGLRMVGPASAWPQTAIAAVPAWDQTRQGAIERGQAQRALAITPLEDTSFDYPAQIMAEIMAYQCAVDWKRKIGEDAGLLLERLGNRDKTAGPITGLWLRLYQSLVRDEHGPDRINHRYQQPWGIW